MRAERPLRVLCFAMGEHGHFQRLRAVIAGIARRGARAVVYTHARFAAAVRRAGGEPVDLFAGRRLEDADDESIPVPSRFVTFAALHGETVAREVAALRPQLVVSDTFSVIGRVVASRLELPFVNVCAGHNLDPARVLAELAVDPRVRTSERCWRAVERLRELGVADASPFAYVTGASPWLNLYCEPPAYLDADQRRPFEPLAFFGSLPATDELDELCAPRAPRFPPGATRRIFVSFGTVIWRYYAAAARAALAAIADAVADMPGARALISLGRAAVDAASLARANVAVHDYVDQWAVLGEADALVTHHGMNSTHEAIWRGVPMISYPFFWDQPSLAAKCQALGLAVPLVDGGALRGAVTPADVRHALGALDRRRDDLAARLRVARGWEIETLAGREAIVDRMLELGGCSATI